MKRKPFIAINLNQAGFSILEVILSVAIFIAFGVASVIVVIQGLNTNRLGNEITIANQYASEGLEALRSIKNQAYASVTNTAPTTGLIRNGSNVWAYSGTNNTLGSDSRFVRTVTVSDVQRDGGGNITSGTLDANTKKVVSKVAWNFNSARPEDVTLTSYFTNWKAAISAGNPRGGMLVYGDNITAPTATPRYRTYSSSTNTFIAEAQAVAGTLPRSVKVKTSPTQNEAIAGYLDSAGNLQIMCWNGTTWTNEWSQVVGGTGTTARFGISYETTTGDALIVYSTNAATTNEMGYRTKLGSTACGSANWSAHTVLNPVRTAGIVQWIRMEASPVTGSNRIYLAWADAASDLSAMAWDGTGWTIAEPAAALETTLEFATAAQDVQSFDIAVESLTSNAMVVWGLTQATTCTAGTIIATTNCIRFSRYTTSWSPVAVIPTVADPATNIDISANPNTDQLVLASVDNSQADLSIAYWSGTTWTGFANVDITSQAAAAGTKLIATGWLINGATTRYVVTYNDAATTNIGWYVGSPTFTTAPTLQTDFTAAPVFASPQKWYDIQTDPFNKNIMMFTLSDNNTDLFAKRLTMTAVPAFAWTNDDASVALELTLGQAIAGPFGFAYWRAP